METLYAILIFVAIVVIMLAGGRRNTSDVDHYMGFENLRSRRKPGPNRQKNKGNAMEVALPLFRLAVSLTRPVPL
ncbi:hypothetical protein ASD44_17845 [Mesorhizobium sp. Root554]|nr:hypothetical protein ASD27_17850 [Mesorhizobium sp. Root1471]KQZ38213.1 hypothetical protein ASD44_17845 [Mesorhizobium sp. Root554]